MFNKCHSRSGTLTQFGTVQSQLPSHGNFFPGLRDIFSNNVGKVWVGAPIIWQLLLQHCSSWQVSQSYLNNFSCLIVDCT